MKKILYFAVTILIATGFVACNDDEDGASLSSSPQVESAGKYTGKWTLTITQKLDENGDIKWTECKSPIEWSEAKIEGSFLGEAVVNIKGSLNEKLGSKKKNDAGYDGKHTDGYIDGEGAITAEVKVYGPGGENDKKTYIGFTMSSDSELFGID